jgi:hypothetical protein
MRVIGFFVKYLILNFDNLMSTFISHGYVNTTKVDRVR